MSNLGFPLGANPIFCRFILKVLEISLVRTALPPPPPLPPISIISKLNSWVQSWAQKCFQLRKHYGQRFIQQTMQISRSHRFPWCLFHYHSSWHLFHDIFFPKKMDSQDWRPQLAGSASYILFCMEIDIEQDLSYFAGPWKQGWHQSGHMMCLANRNTEFSHKYYVLQNMSQ